jgi:hypothetical protein
MRTLSAIVAAVCLVAAAPASSAAQPPPISADAYQLEIGRLITDISRLSAKQPDEANPLIASLPRSWRVAAGDRTWEIPATWLRRDLAAWRAKPEASALARTLAHLRALHDDAAGYLQPASDRSGARATLAGILSAREFQRVKGPTWLDRLRQQVMAWLIDILDRTIGSSLLPTISNILVYALIVVAVVLVGVWVARSLRRSASAEAAALDLAIVPVRPWHEWLAQARAAADAGNWRDAVRLAYWCGVMYLETEGAWRADRSRTPREYVRLLPAASPQTAPLQSLTRLLERIWYGGEAASRERFEDALSDLRKLGCPSV